MVSWYLRIMPWSASFIDRNVNFSFLRAALAGSKHLKRAAALAGQSEVAFGWSCPGKGARCGSTEWRPAAAPARLYRGRDFQGDSRLPTSYVRTATRSSKKRTWSLQRKLSAPNRPNYSVIHGQLTPKTTDQGIRPNEPAADSTQTRKRS
jgi:hypothetical protein